MGFSFNIGKAITRAVGIPDKSFVAKAINIATLPISLPTNLALGAGQKLFSSIGGPSPGVQAIHDNAPQPVGEGNVLQPTSPSYVYYAGGGGYSPYTGGQQSWDYSTQLTPYSPPQFQTYPAYSAAPPAPQDRTWEDLTLAAAAFL